jgi:TonB family protein
VLRRTLVTGFVFVVVASAALATRAENQQPQPAVPSEPSRGLIIRPVYSAPTRLTIVQPDYTAAAIQERVEGDVGLEAIVTGEGVVSEVRVVKSLDQQYGLDDQAVSAARQWRFPPHGKPNPVAFSLLLQFRLDGVAQSAATPDDFGKGATPVDAPGLIKPIVVKSPSPAYTSEAMRARIQGSVDVQVVIDTMGSVVRARLLRAAWATERVGSDISRDTPGLIDSAMTAARAWVFQPGKLGELPVPVLATVTMNFRIH